MSKWLVGSTIFVPSIALNNKGKHNLFTALEAQHFSHWCVTTIIIFIVSITLLSMQVMHCEYFKLIKPSIISYRTLFAQLNLHSWLGYLEISDGGLSKKRDKPGKVTLTAVIYFNFKRNNQKVCCGFFWGGDHKLKLKFSSSLPNGNSAAKMTRLGSREHCVFQNRLQKYLAAANTNHLPPNLSDILIFSKVPLKWK